MIANLERSLPLIASRLAAWGCGSLVIDPQALAHLADNPKVGCHHIGGTRMHSDPRQGVVDGNGRVQGCTGPFWNTSS